MTVATSPVQSFTDAENEIMEAEARLDIEEREVIGSINLLHAIFCEA